MSFLAALRRRAPPPAPSPTEECPTEAAAQPRAATAAEAAAEKDEAAAAAAAAAAAPAAVALSLASLSASSPAASLVVDANAVMLHGAAVAALGERLYTVPEVLAEVRDARSRLALEALQREIAVREPSEEGVKAVARFARGTGDAHSLSSADTRLMALAWTLEAEAHGTAHLSATPTPLREQSKRERTVEESKMPGWGKGVDPAEWEELDRINAEAEAAAEAAAATAVGEDKGVQQQRPPPPQGETREQLGGVQGEEEGDGEWEDSCSRSTRRRRERRERRKEEAGEAGEEAMQRDAQEAEAAEARGEEEDATAEAEAEAAAAAAAAAEPEAEAEAEAAAEEEEEEDLTLPCDAVASTVVTITGDYAMQNVLLQMGLRLAAPDGRRISQLKRFVLRCHACGFMGNAVGRLFCGRCGNASLVKASVEVGPSGRLLVGRKQRITTRGTRFTLARPQGGREGAEKAPLLAEDQLIMQRGNHSRPKKKDSSVDPFAAEYSDDTWHTTNRVNLPKGHLGNAAILGMGSASRNPNERRFVARRRH